MTDIVERLNTLAELCRHEGTPISLGNALHFEAAAAELVRLRAASEWRDISTAPRDGTFILAYQPDRVMDTVAWDVSREGWMNGYDDKKNYPTHWKPLPAPPQRNEVTK